MNEKPCSRCKLVFPIAHYPNTNRGLPRAQCRACWNTYVRERKQKINDMGEDAYRLMREEQKRKGFNYQSTRDCSRCGRNLPASGFHNDSSSKDGYSYVCRDCAYERVKIWRQTNSEYERSTRSRREKHQAQGMCRFCSKLLLPNSRSVCEEHYYIQTSRNALRNSSKASGELLRSKLEAQEYKCAYSGRNLILGINASIDHCMPISRFPHLATDPKNIVWADITVNFAKRTLIPQEFISFCGRVNGNLDVELPAFSVIKRKNQILLDTCKHCKSPRYEYSGVYCIKHYLASIAKKALGRSSNLVIEQLHTKFFDQHCRCPYTGEFLIWGVNVQLDHKFPRSRFPELQSDIDNVEWVHILANKIKRDQTPEEFLGMCKEIVEYAHNNFYQESSTS